MGRPAKEGTSRLAATRLSVAAINTQVMSPVAARHSDKLSKPAVRPPADGVGGLWQKISTEI